MGTITKRTCDRCGKELKYIGWTSVLRGSRIGFLKLYNGNLSGYDYSRNEYELCTDCTNGLCDFLNMKGGAE